MPKIDSRGRIVLPPMVRERMGLPAGGLITFTQTRDGWVIQRADLRSVGDKEALAGKRPSK